MRESWMSVAEGAAAPTMRQPITVCHVSAQGWPIRCAEEAPAHALTSIDDPCRGERDKRARELRIAPAAHVDDA